MDLLRLFFGPDTNDTRGDVFFHLGYNGTQYDKAINADNINSIMAEPLLQTMLNINYNDYPLGNPVKIHKEFYEFIRDVALHHATLDNKEPIGNDELKNKVLNIYKNPNVPVNVRKFFETHLKVIDINTREPVTVTDSTDLKSVRFNLVKVSPSDEDKEKILFASTLPLLPSNVHTQQDILIKYYNEQYSSYSLINHRSDYKSFNFNLSQLIKNTILARDVTIKPSLNDAKPIEDLYESIVTGVRYSRDESGALRVVNSDGKLGKTFDDNELETALKQSSPNCATTGIKLSDCSIVYKCLLSGKPETLSECLDKLKAEPMFEVARKEVDTMNPKIAVQLLRTFGFKPRKEAGSNVVLPPTFDEWLSKLSKTVDASTAEAIRGNKKLMEYLKAVVNIIRSNPAIINSDFKNGVLSDFAKKSGLTVFRNSFPERKVAESVVDGVLFTPQPLMQSMKIPLALNIANISRRVNIPFLMGGSKTKCQNAENFRQAFNMIFTEMEKNGKILVDSDKARIDATISKLDKLESNLTQLMDDAKLFNKLNSALNPTQSVSTENITLKNIVDVRSQNITGETLDNLNDCIVKNLRDQTQLSTDLVNKVQMPLLQLLLKGGSNALSPVN